MSRGKSTFPFQGGLFSKIFKPSMYCYAREEETEGTYIFVVFFGWPWLLWWRRWGRAWGGRRGAGSSPASEAPSGPALPGLLYMHRWAGKLFFKVCYRKFLRRSSPQIANPQISTNTSQLYLKKLSFLKRFFVQYVERNGWIRAFYATFVRRKSMYLRTWRSFFARNSQK